MADTQTNNEPSPLLGGVCIVVGLFPIARALHWIPPEAGSADAPDWVIFLCGFVFEVSGLMLLVGDQNKRLTDALVAVFALAMGGAAVWVALLSPSEGMGGGIPFLPRALNVLVSRCVFGIGALFSLWIAQYAALSAVKGRSRGR